MPIDTQQVVETLMDAGEQAKAHASVLNEALQDHELRSRDQFVTRQDLAEALAPIHEALIRLEAAYTALDAKIGTVEKKIDTVEKKIDIKIDAAVSRLRAEVALWIVSAGFLQTGLIAALILEVAS